MGRPAAAEEGKQGRAISSRSLNPAKSRSRDSGNTPARDESATTRLSEFVRDESLRECPEARPRRLSPTRVVEHGQVRLPVGRRLPWGR